MQGPLRHNLDSVRARMAAACARAGRAADAVRLVAVTKSVGPEVVQALASLGVTDVGENRVQQAQAKHDALGGSLGLAWHMIGHLQTNKARHAVRLFAMVHSVDSPALAAELDRRCGGTGVPPVSSTGQRPVPPAVMPILLQCNVSGEATKSGVEPDALLPLLDAILPLEHVRVEGLMTMAPFVDDPEATRPVFAALRALAEKARAATGLPLPHLSMGMTQDFEVAIEEGATLVRVGTALFQGL